jgi:hypothetical protein
MRWSLTYKRAGTGSTSSLAFACDAKCRARISKTVAGRNAQADRPEPHGQLILMTRPLLAQPDYHKLSPTIP